MFLGPFCLAVHKGKEGWGRGVESIISQLLHTKKYCSAFRNILVQMPAVTGDQCYAILTQLYGILECYKIVTLDLVQEVWNWVGNPSLIFHTHMAANCGVRMVSVSSSLETMVSNTVHLKETHLVQSCLEILPRSPSLAWKDRGCLCLWVCAAIVCCHTGAGKRQPLPLAEHSAWLGLLILSVCLIIVLIV